MAANIDIPDRDHPARKLGMGRLHGNTPSEKKASIVNEIKKVIGAPGMPGCPTYNLPVLDNVTIHYQGPLTDNAVAQTFGNVINPLGANPETPPPGSVGVDTTFAQPGEFQTYNMICAIQWRLDFEPQEFTVLGNSWTTPASGAPIPVSPDDFNVNTAGPADTVVNGPLGLQAGEVMQQAALQWGWWAALAGFYMTRGFNLQWQMGNRNLLLNDQLRYTAFTPSNAMNGSASNSDVDVNYAVRRTNNYYRASSTLNSPQIFLTADRTRLGNMTLAGPGGAGSSVFRPTRAYEFVGATMGGIALRNFLQGNQEFRRLSAPIIWGPGIPIGLKAVVGASSDDANNMRNYLSWTQGFGGTGPASFTPDANINAGASQLGTNAVTGAEPSFDTPVAAQSQRLNSARTIFKGGSWKLTVAFKGFELTPDQADTIGSADVQAAIKSECGCACMVR